MRIQGAQRIVIVRRPRAALARAGIFSCGLHVVALACVLGLPWRTQVRAVAASAVVEPIDIVEPTLVDLVDLAAPESELVPLSGEDRASVDQGTDVGLSAAPRVAIANEFRGAAADQGAGQGRPLPPAFRRDTSSLRARISDGASVYRPAHERTARVATSPQAVREEPHPGPGDSARSRAQAERQAAPNEERGQGDFVEAAPQRTAGDDDVRSQGPLDTETGPRRYDVALRGPARDNAWSRAASDENQPSVMDLSAAAAVGNSSEGRGPGEAPGALPRPSNGLAPSRSGLAASVLGQGSDSAGEGVQDHYYFDLDRRVTAVVHFPKQLALELRQGDAIVTFTVAPNGRVAGPIQVAKSAGFPAFDDEAVAAVQRAAPFPPPGKPRPISLRVWFRNPMVR